VVVFVLDVRSGLSAQDHDIARYLRTTARRVLLAVNKAEGMADSPRLAEFHELGMGEPHPISAAHGQGIRSLVEAAFEGFPEVPEESEEPDADKPIRLAVAGRPNVGKSTLINTWLGEERLVAFDQPGTTRDAIHVPFEHGGRRFDLIDTAGLRRKGRVFESIEKFSVVKTLQAIADANVVLLLLDATQGVTDQDAHIAGYILESGRAVVVAVNKWDAVDVRPSAAHLGEEAAGPGPAVEGHRRGPCLGGEKAADAGADPAAARGGAAPGAQARRPFPPEAALRPPGRHESADRGDPRQFAGTRDRCLQALPGRALPRAFQAGRHATAGGDALVEESFRGTQRLKATPIHAALHCGGVRRVIRSHFQELHHGAYREQ
jgi:small GTP-binding protein